MSALPKPTEHCAADTASPRLRANPAAAMATRFALLARGKPLRRLARFPFVQRHQIAMFQDSRTNPTAIFWPLPASCPIWLAKCQSRSRSVALFRASVASTYAGVPCP